MRKCLLGWMKGNFGFYSKLSSNQISIISNHLEKINDFKPKEIHREIRRLDYIKVWKGSEFRSFLLYTGPIVLKQVLRPNIYQHFLVLLCAVRIVSSKQYIKYINVAEELFKDYIKQFIQLYGRHSISSNVHNLCHVVEDVKKFGPLPYISTYPFENFLGYLKSLIRTGKLPLQQIAKRVTELSALNENISKRKTHDILAEKEIRNVPHQLSSCTKVFTRINYKNQFVLSSDKKNMWFLTKSNEIVKMLNATFLNGILQIYGSALKKKFNFFEVPIKSSYLDIYESDGSFHKPKLYAVENNIKCKLFCIEVKENIVLFPMIHTLELDVE